MDARNAAAPPERKRRARFRLLLLILAISFSVAEAGTRFGVLDALERVYSDLWHRSSGVRYAPQHVVLAVIDDLSLAQYSDDPLVFWTPLFAQAAAVLRHTGAAVIGFDIFFSITPENWLRKHVPEVQALQNYDLAYRQALNAGNIVLVGAVTRGVGGSPDRLHLQHPDYLLSLPNMDLLSHVGLADLISDEDGGVRKYAIAPKLNLAPELAAGAPRFSFGALLALRAAGASSAAAGWRIANRDLSRDGIYPITYAGPPGTFPRVSFARLLAPDAANDPVVKAMRGKVVIVGGEFQHMNDVHPTPYSGSLWGMPGRLMPGPEIQANIVETLLSGRDTRALPDWLRWMLLATLAGLSIGIYQRISPWAGLGVLAAGCATVLALAYAAFQAFWLAPAAHAQLGLAAAYIMAFGARLTSEERERQRVKTMFEGYVSDSVVEMLLSSERRVDLGGQAMHITVLFSDIRNFTTITEKLSAHETVEFLNAYFERVIDAIREEGGRIDKFIGDAVMAEFGAPYPFADHALQALRAAARMSRIAEEFKGWMRNRFSERDIPEFAIGIGIHTGEAVVGNVGSAQRMEFTAIGDTVNVASRLEGETKTLNCVIVASAATVRAVGGRVATGRHETLKVKGRAEAVEVYEIVEIHA